MTQRTQQQNNALHLFFDMLADALNDAGLDMKKTLKHDVEIPWNGDRVKEFMWKPVQDAMLDKESTTELSTGEVSEVYEVLNRHLSSKLGVSVPFPSNEPPMIGD